MRPRLLHVTEQAGAKAEDTFELSADGPILAQPRSSCDGRSRPPTRFPTVKAIAIYQDLMRFHQGDKDPTAFLNVDSRGSLWDTRRLGEEKAPDTRPCSGGLPMQRGQ